MNKGKLSILFILVIQLNASGWDNPIMGLRSLSMNAAFTAFANDPSAIYHNPAGIVQCNEGWTVQAEGVYVIPHHFAQLESGKRAESSWKNLVPQGFFVLRQRSAALGLGVYIPFGGGGIDYSKKDLGEAIRAYLGVLAFTGVISRYIRENLLIGGGVSLLNAQNKARVVKDDGEIDILERGKSWTVSFGLIWNASKKVRLGFSYRGPASIKLTGWTHLPFPDDTFSSETRINLPYSASCGILLKPSQNGIVTLDLTYTHWAVLDSVRGEINIPGFVGGVPKGEALGFQDVVKATVGTEWWITRKVSVRGGVAYDPAAADARYLTPTNIDVNKIAISFGLGYLLGSSQINFTVVKMSGRERKILTGSEPGIYNMRAILFGIGTIFSF